MKPDTRHILSVYQHLMQPHERLAARWLTEGWDGGSSKLPSWLRSRLFAHFPPRLLDAPEELARFILLRLLQDHRSGIHAGKRAGDGGTS